MRDGDLGRAASGGGRQPTQTADRTRATGHPLDPLRPEEIAAASDILRRSKSLAETARFVYVTLREPPKPAVLSYQPGTELEREAFVVLRERAERKTYEAVVSLTRGEVTSWREVPNVQPPIMFEEFLAAEAAVKQDPRWRAAMRRRGIEDLENVMIDPWSVGYNGPEDAASKGRFIRPLTWVRQGPEDNGYARPIEGLVVRFDLDSMTVVEVEDHGVAPIPPRAANYTAETLIDPNNFPSFPEGTRRDVKPIEVHQPEGPSWRVEGHRVEWQRWSFRVGFTPREGLVLHTISYRDRGEERPIVYRASLAEMFIPYGDPNPTHYRKNVFDMGEYGIGVLANSLALGCDCLGLIHYFDAWVNDNDGRPLRIENAICLHEEDFGILWKHTDFRTMKAEVRRSRRLVVSMFATVGNYDYGYFWYFYPDGTIQFEVKLTGIISNGVYADGEEPKHGVKVAPNVYGPNHQHFFCVRLDMMVDGIRNTVYECDSVPVPPGPENPHGNAWVVRQTPISRESEAARLADPLRARYWKIANTSRRNAVGDPVAYKLEPGPSTPPLYQPGVHAIRRAQFCTRNLWVTAYDPLQLFPAGDYVNQHPGGDGLPRYQQADRPLEDADLVVWHSFVAHHVPRPEDWPVMPCSYVGFHLRPVGFFDGNPSLDMPLLADHCSHREHEPNGKVG
ncbi:MAG TPA: primary-amine oxidase [Candidatus Dormibacteraeota bacterium]|nr:primary-amine oxidase [Candidatus Dormibacteraeota bacterium]